MKKTLKVLVMATAFSLVSSLGLAAIDGSYTQDTTITDPNGGSGVSITVELSPNVRWAYRGADGAYTIGASNTQGDRTFGTGSNVSGLKVNTGGIEQAIPSTAGGDFATTNWSDLGG